MTFSEARAFQSAQDLHHEDVSSREVADKPIGVAKGACEFAEAARNAIFNDHKSLLVPRFVPFEVDRALALDNDWLNRTDGREHPGDRPCSVAGTVR